MIFTVKREHILKGNRGDCKTCPVALAIHEQTGVADVNADLAQIRIGAKVFVTPVKVLKFMRRFDYGESKRTHMHLLTFELPYEQEKK